MAEGGDTTFENPAYEPYPWDDDDDYDDRGDETTPFLPATSSTPHSGEEIEMQTMRREKSGDPDKSYVETSFGAPKTSEQAWLTAKDLFPNMSSSELEVSYNTRGRIQVKMFGAGKKLYNLTTTEKGTGREQINKSLPKEIKAALGPSKYERLQQITYEKRKEMKKKEYDALQKGKNKKEMDEIRQSLTSAQRELESLENSDAPQSEVDKVKEKIRTLEAEHTKASNKYFKSFQAERDKTNSEENISVLEDIQDEDLLQEEENNTSEALKAIRKRKEALDWRKKIELDKTLDPDLGPEQRQLAQEKLIEIDKSYQQIVAEEKIFEEKLGVKHSLTDEKRKQLEKDKEALEKANKEDRVIINDRDADPDEKRRAEERVAFREREIRQINTQLEENKSISEKVKEIFKKYGVTVTAIFLAAGVTIGAVIATITNALKAMGKQMANGLKALGAKAASALPGLIGAIVSFLFKTAGQVLGFLAEHTWLLILAVVVFLVENYTKRRR